MGDAMLQDELVEYLVRTIPAGPRKTRDIDVSLFFYGFAGAAWPSMEVTAKAFGIGSREWVRQILGAVLPDRAAGSELPRLGAVAERLRSRPFWLASDFCRAIAQGGEGAGLPSAPGLLSLLHHLQLAADYEIYDTGLTPLRRSRAKTNADAVFGRPAAVTPLRSVLQEARRFGRRVGLAHTRQLTIAEDDAVGHELIKRLLRASADCWTKSAEAGEFWFAPEEDANALVQLAAKAFAVTRAAPPRRLAGTLANALRGRSRHLKRIDPAIVEAWIGGSRYFAQAEGGVAFLGPPARLTSVEKELICCLSARAHCDYKVLKDHLLARGVAPSLVSKVATLSPLVFVDRSEGLRSFRYSLVGHD
jgi:hypothetical protein